MKAIKNENKKTLELLKKSEEKYRLILENAYDLIAILNQKYEHEYINEKAYLNVLGYSKDDMLKKTRFDLIHPEDLKLSMKTLKNGFKYGIGKTELRLKHKNGHYLWFEVKGKLFVDNKGEKKAILISRDINKRKLAEENLKESEEKFRHLYENSPNAIIITNFKGDIIDCNLTSEKLSGFKKSELIGHNIIDISFIPREFFPLILKDLKALYKEKNIPPREIQLYKKDRSLAWVSYQVSVVQYRNEKVIQVIIEELTEKRKLEQKLKESEAKYRSLINNLSDVIADMDSNGKFTYISPQCYEIFGYQQEEVIGQSAFDFVHPEDITRVVETMKKALRNKEFVSLEYKIRHKNGNYIPVYARGKLVTIGDHKEYIGVIRDITERKKAEQKLKKSEEKLRESEKKYRIVAEFANDLISLFDAEGNFQYCNEAFKKVLGYEPKDLLGENMIDFIYPADKNVLLQYGKTIIQDHNGLIEIRLKHKNGSYRWIESTTSVLYDEKTGKALKFLVIGRDITKRKRAYEKLRESEKKSREAYDLANFYKDLFAHDINNILQNILTSYELCKIYLDDPKKENQLNEILDIIKEQVKRGANLISKVRKLSEIEESQIPIQAIEVSTVLNKTIKFIKNTIQDKNIEIQIESIDKKIYVQANNLLEDIIRNIFINATNYNDNSTVEVIIKISKKQKNGIKYVKIEFIDNGIGIPDARKKIIFQKGYKKKLHVKGMGFGLTLVKKILESYNAQIWVEDKIKGDYSKGSNFVILIPEAV